MLFIILLNIIIILIKFLINYFQIKYYLFFKYFAKLKNIYIYFHADKPRKRDRKTSINDSLCSLHMLCTTML